MLRKSILGIVILVIMAVILVGIANLVALERDKIRPGRGRPMVTGGPSTNNPPMPNTEVEEKILSVLEDLGKTQGAMQNVPMEDGRLLRVFTEATGARNVVEIGTSNGYSALWFCLALHSTGGKLTTFEIDHSRVLLARENFKRASVDHIVTVIEGDAHIEVMKLKEPIDILFLDADKQGYPDYLNKLLPLVRPGGLIVAHNMKSPPPDPEYLKAITTNPDLETIFLNMHSSGVGVTLKKR